MTRASRLAALFLLLVLAATEAAPALADGTIDFAYGGRITEANGKPIGGDVALKITFFHDKDGQTEILSVTEGLGKITLQQGIFQFRLPLPAADYDKVFKSADQPVWIKVTDLTHPQKGPFPLQQVMVVPYAAKVPVDGTTLSFNNEGKLTAGPSSAPSANQFITKDSQGRLVWATPNTSAAALQGQNVSATAPATGQVLKFDGTQWLPATMTSGTLTAVTAAAPLVNNGTATVPALSITQANSVSNGYVSSADWLTFNSKQAALGFTPVNKSGDTMAGGLNMSFINLKDNDVTDHYLRLNANPAMSADLAYTFPATDGTVGQVLTTNGAGTFTWASGASVSGAAGGDLGGTYPNPTVANVGGATAANVAAGAALANAGTSTNTASTLVKRDATGSFAAGTITANLVGNISGNAATATSTTSFTGALAGDVTGTQGAAMVSTVGASSAANIHAAELLANAATNANTVSTLVKRDAGGNFTAGTITATLIGNASTATSAGSFTGALVGNVTGTQGATVVATVGGVTAGSVATGANLANTAASTNTVSTLVKRDAAGNFAAGTITANLTGNVTGLATNLTGLPLATGVIGTLPVANGGTGVSTASNGQLLIGNGSGFTLAALSAGSGSGLSITNSAGGISIGASTTCRTGYILVPHDDVFTFKDFCVMKYEAQVNGTTGLPASTSAGSPWVSISWYSAKDACQRAGAHLVNEGEYMTIARNIEATTINDLESTAGIQLATGHSDNAPASALSAAADPVISSCTLTLPLSDSSNASTGTCALRGTLPYTGTGQSYTGTYSAGVANDSQMRTHVLSNGNIIWDLAGNVWEWTDMQCDTTRWNSNAGWLEWTNAGLTDWEKLVAGPSGSLTSANGAGQYYGCTASADALLRGADWNDGAYAGVFAALLNSAPTLVSTHVGFRCALQP